MPSIAIMKRDLAAARAMLPKFTKTADKARCLNLISRLEILIARGLMQPASKVTPMLVPISDANRVLLDAQVAQLAKTLDYLAQRWSDESEYEDFADYEAAVKKTLPDTFRLTKMTKRPFGIRFTFAGAEFSLRLHQQAGHPDAARLMQHSGVGKKRPRHGASAHLMRRTEGKKFMRYVRLPPNEAAGVIWRVFDRDGAPLCEVRRTPNKKYVVINDLGQLLGPANSKEEAVRTFLGDDRL